MRRPQAESNAVSITVFDTSIGIHDEMLYKVHLTPTLSRARFFLFFRLSVFPLSPPLCVDGLTRAGLVERRVWDHRKRGRPVEAPDDICPSMQAHRGRPDQARDLHHYHFLPSRWARESERPQLGSLRAHSRVIGALKHSCARMSVEFHLF